MIGRKRKRETKREKDVVRETLKERGNVKNRIILRQTDRDWKREQKGTKR